MRRELLKLTWVLQRTFESLTWELSSHRLYCPSPGAAVPSDTQCIVYTCWIKETEKAPPNKSTPLNKALGSVP